MRHQAWYLDFVIKRNPAFDPTPFAGDWSAATDGTWKLIRSTTGDVRLYHLPEDRAEEVDLAASNPEVVAPLASRLDALPQFRNATQDPAEIPPETRDRLRSLGYVD